MCSLEWKRSNKKISVHLSSKASEPQTQESWHPLLFCFAQFYALYYNTSLNLQNDQALINGWLALLSTNIFIFQVLFFLMYQILAHFVAKIILYDVCTWYECILKNSYGLERGRCGGHKRTTVLTTNFCSHKKMHSWSHEKRKNIFESTQVLT